MTVPKQAYTAESIISGVPWTVNGTCSGSTSHFFADKIGNEYDSQWASVTNTGLSGTIHVGFTSGAIALNQSYPLNAGESLHESLLTNKVYISGGLGVPYNITAGLTGIKTTVPTTPAEMTDVYAWWKADAGLNLSGSSANSWTDVISGHTVHQTVATRNPTYTSANPNFNNKPTLSFNATVFSNFFTNEVTSSWSFLNDITGSTMAIVYRTEVTAALGVLGTHVAGAAYTGRSMLLNYPVTSQIQTRYSVSGSAFDTKTITLSSSLATNTNYYISSLTSNRIMTKTNATGFDIQTHTATLSNAAPSSFFCIGLLQGYGYFTGDIAEVIVFRRALNESDMVVLGRYFSNKYNLRISI